MDVTVTGIFTIIQSPGTPNKLVLMDEEDREDATSVVLRHWDDDVLICRGATLAPPVEDGSATTATNKALAMCGVVSDCCIVTGITMGDVESGLANTRHARTLSTIFRAQLALDNSKEKKEEEEEEQNTTKTIILTIPKSKVTEDEEATLSKAVESLYQAAVAAGKPNGKVPNFKDMYELIIMEESPEVT